MKKIMTVLIVMVMLVTVGFRLYGEGNARDFTHVTEKLNYNRNQFFKGGVLWH